MANSRGACSFSLDWRSAIHLRGVSPLSLDPLTLLVWALCCEVGIYIVQAEESAAARQEIVGRLERLLTGLWRGGEEHCLR